MSSAINILGWREILARVLDGFQVQEDVSPAWLVNPATNRPLKLNQLYPEVGLAIRFVGLTAKGQPRQSDDEAQTEAQRDEIRAELCSQNNTELLLIDPDYPHPPEQFQRLRSTLSRLSRTLAQSDRPEADKLAFMPRLADARARLDDISRRVRSPEDLALFADLWRDREADVFAAARQAAPPRSDGPAPTFEPGQVVQHERFGKGAVIAVNGAGPDAQVTVHFADDSQRIFLAGLVAGKLAPQ